MSLHSYLRLASIVIVAALGAYGGKPVTFLTTVVLGLSHYFLSAVYSRKQILAVLKRPATGAKAAGAMALGLGMYFAKIPLIFLFGMHHVFNETYMVATRTGTSHTSDERALSRLNLARGLVTAFVYAFLLRWLLFLPARACDFLLLGMAASYAYMLGAIIVARPLLSTKQFIDSCVLELASIPLVAISFAYNIWFMQIVLYHFLVWAVYPVPKIMRQGNAALARYLILSAVAMTVCTAISPVNFRAPHLNPAQLWQIFVFFSYIHIISALFTSTAQPALINRFFGLQEKGSAKNSPSPAIKEPAISGRL